MVKRELKRQPPSLYYKGETILVRIPTSKKPVKGKKNSLKSSCEGRVVDVDHTAHKYQIEFKDPNTLKYKTAWFKVDDVTSLTKEDESKRQRIAHEQSCGGKRKTFAVEPDQEKAASKVKRTEAQFQNPSVLDISLDQILSAEKLNGDTVKLYFDFLREKHTCGMEDLCLGSSYFYPSLKQSDDNRERYRKYIGKKSLWEYEDVMIPVHLGMEKHWLLVVISVLNLCIYIYDSVCSSLSTYRTIFDTIKTNFIRRELQCLSSEERVLFQEENWEEETPKCPKQKNEKDCGVFTCLLAKNLLFAKNSENIEWDDNIRSEMASDLLNLSTTETRVDDLPDNLQWIVQNGFQASPKEVPKIKLDREVANAGLTYRQPPTPKDGNCLFHAMSDLLTRVGKAPQTASQLRSDLVSYLRSNPTTPDGIHYREFINHGGWDSYLRRMSMDGEWGDWIALWGLTNMLNIPVALVSSLGEAGLRIINPNAREQETGDFGALALLGHEAEVHFHSLEPASDTANPKDVVSELKERYGEGKVTEEICPNRGKKFQCFSKGVFEGAHGMLQVYSDDNVFCDNCEKYGFN